MATASRRLLILNGSPRPNGNSAALVEEAAAGARSAGATVEVVRLADLDIRPCDACDSCQETGGGMCVVRDDMQSLYPRVRGADSILIASPIYWFTVTAQTKLFIDRLYALQGEAGNILGGKRFGVMLTYGDPDPYSSGAVNAIRMFQDMLRYVEADLVGLVYGSANAAGEIRNLSGVMKKAHELGVQLA